MKIFAKNNTELENIFKRFQEQNYLIECQKLNINNMKSKFNYGKVKVN